MVSKVKLYAQLDALEIQLIDSLVPHLKNAAEGKNDLVFCVSAFNSIRELKNKTDVFTEELVEIGSQILALKEKLGESSNGTVADRICWYCREWSKSSRRDKTAGKILAEKFLLEIKRG